MSEKISPVTISPYAAQRMGFARGCVGIPVSDQANAPFYVVGLVADGSRVTFSPDTYRFSGAIPVRAGSKTYSHVGMVGSLNFDHQSNSRVPPEIKYSNAIREAIGVLRQTVADTIGSDIVTSDTLPGEFRPINLALDLARRSKKDHARLVLRWSWLIDVFIERPEILDKAVAGDSLWSLLPDSFDPGVIEEIRKLKGFTSAWLPSGMTVSTFVPKLAGACVYIPKGGQRPVTSAEAQALTEVVDFYDRCFADVPGQVQEALKHSAVAEGRNWRGTVHFDAAHTGDYVSFVYRNILLETFRLLGVRAAPDQAIFAGVTALFGNVPARIAQASRQWHNEMWANRRHVDPATGRQVQNWERTSRRLVRSWSACFERLTAPNGLHVVPLDTSELLMDEGRTQHHCVSTRWPNCAEGKMRVASVRSVSDKGEKTLSTFSFTTDGSTISVTEHRGFANGDAGEEAKEAVWWFVESANSKDRPFPMDLRWLVEVTHETEAAPEAEVLVDLRGEIAAEIEACEAMLPKKIQRGGLDALLAELRPHLTLD